MSAQPKSVLSIYDSRPVNEGKPDSGGIYDQLDPSLRPDTETHEGPLTLNEREELGRREQRIERGLRQWREVGEDLGAIQAKRLYREKYSTFEEYVATRWGISRREGYRTIAAAKAANNVQPQNAAGSAAPSPVASSPETSTTPSATPPVAAVAPVANADAPRGNNKLGTPFLTKAAARALANYTPETQRRVWERLTTGERPNMEPSASDIQKTAAQILIEAAQKQVASLPPRDQKKIGRDESNKLSAAARKKKAKEKMEKDRAKLVRWIEKIPKLVERMEKSGDWPQLEGMAVKLLAIENEVKVRLAGKG